MTAGRKLVVTPTPIYHQMNQWKHTIEDIGKDMMMGMLVESRRGLRWVPGNSDNGL